MLQFPDCKPDGAVIGARGGVDDVVEPEAFVEVHGHALVHAERTHAADRMSDPRLDLVRQLVEYKKFKDAASRLADLVEASAISPRTSAAV